MKKNNLDSVEYQNQYAVLKDLWAGRYFIVLIVTVIILLGYHFTYKEYVPRVVTSYQDTYRINSYSDQNGIMQPLEYIDDLGLIIEALFDVKVIIPAKSKSVFIVSVGDTDERLVEYKSQQVFDYLNEPSKRHGKGELPSINIADRIVHQKTNATIERKFTNKIFDVILSYAIFGVFVSSFLVLLTARMNKS